MFKIIKKADIILFIILIIIGFALAVPSFGHGTQGSMVVIRVNGELYGEYPISQNREINVVSGSHSNKVIIKDGVVQMEEASCHNQLCVKQGSISTTNQQIICLPNRVVVEIVSDNEEGAPDVISG